MTERPQQWWKHSVVYQVYVRSFADSDDDGVGDLEGVRRRLEYLDWLGVDAIWLSPVYPSAHRDFGYDITDYTDVDPLFGDLDSFARLVSDSHSIGIRVLLDWVPNHTSSDHPWFLDSARSRTSPRRDWYVWADGNDGGPPNNWQSVFPKVGSAWSNDPRTGQWYLHSHLPEQPDLNWDNADVEAAQHDIMRFWLDRDVDGFRIDVVHNLGKDPRLSDNPDLIVRPSPDTAGVRHDEDYWPNLWPKIERLRNVLDEYDAIGIGETYVLDPHRLAAYTRPGRLHLAHDFTLTETPWDADQFAGRIEAANTALGPKGWPAWIFASHDHGRVASRWDEGGRLAINGGHVSRERAEAGYALLYLMKGTPFIFQGEELGLPDAVMDDRQMIDIDGRDRARTPIPWQPSTKADPGAGFTSGVPWLPIDAGASGLEVETQRRAPTSTLRFHRSLIRLRRYPAFLCGDQHIESHGDIIFVRRTHRTDSAMILINTSPDSRSVTMDQGAIPLLLRRSRHARGSVDLGGHGVAVFEGPGVRR